MEVVEAGYKKTEVGLIPSDWNYHEIGEYIDLLTGFPFPSSKYAKSGVRLLKGSNVKRGQTDWSEKISDFWGEDLYKYKDFELKAGDLVVAMDGSLVGRSYAQISKQDLPALLLQRVARLRSTKLSITYLKYFIGSDWFVKYSDSVKTVTAIPHISPKDIRQFQIPLPPTITEQKAIATALSDVDALISRLDQLIEKKKAIKQGAMQELLTPPHMGGKRLEGFSGEWKILLVADYIDVNRGGSPRPINDYLTTSANGINWIKIGDTDSESKYITSSVEKIIPEGVQFSRKVFSGDFLLSNSMSFGRPYILKINGCIHDGWLVLQNYQDSFDREFLYYLLTSRQVYIQYLKRAAGSSVLNLNKELLKSIKLAVPPTLDEQKAIATILSDMDTEIQSLEAKRDKYKQVKLGMMQELLTGKTRLV